MTREEAIKKLKWFRAYNEDDYCGGDRIQDEHGDWYYRITEQDFEAFEMAIKALEQEPIFDKIRAEIEQTVSRYSISRERGGMGQVEWSDFLIKQSEVLKILDKYKTKSEKT